MIFFCVLEIILILSAGIQFALGFYLGGSGCILAAIVVVIGILRIYWVMKGRRIFLSGTSSGRIPLSN